MRSAAIALQKKRGRKTVIVLPVHYPRELLTAMDVHAVELWGPPGSPCGPAAGRIQACVCAVVRNAFAFLASGGGKEADAVLFPHTCDSIQGLATLAPDFGGWGKPAFRYLHPKGDASPAAVGFIRAELASLADRLSLLTGSPLSPPRLSAAIELHSEIDRIKRLLLFRRAHLDMTDAALYRMLRRGEFLWPEDHLEELVPAAREIREAPVQRGIPLMITGYVPEPMSIFSRLEAAGGFVAADDYAAVGRRIPLSLPPPGGDPLDRLAALPGLCPPCPTRSAGLSHRMEHLASLYRRSGAAGLIVHIPKFCEPESFDVPAIYRTFAGIGAPVLFLETELEKELPAQAVTRLEAFMELIKDRESNNC